MTKVTKCLKICCHTLYPVIPVRQVESHIKSDRNGHVAWEEPKLRYECPKNSHLNQIIKPSIAVGSMCQLGKREVRSARQTDYELCLSHFWLDWKWKEQQCHCNNHPVAWATIGFNLTDKDIERGGGGGGGGGWLVHSREKEGNQLFQLWERLNPECHLPSKFLHSFEMLSWISGGKCSNDWWLTRPYLDSFEGR